MQKYGDRQKPPYLEKGSQTKTEQKALAQESSFHSFLEKSLVPLSGSQDGNISHFGSMTLAEGEALQDPRNQKALWAPRAPTALAGLCLSWPLGL